MDILKEKKTFKRDILGISVVLSTFLFIKERLWEVVKFLGRLLDKRYREINIYK
jgi:hypothetical protein